MGERRTRSLPRTYDNLAEKRVPIQEKRGVDFTSEKAAKTKKIKPRRGSWSRNIRRKDANVKKVRTSSHQENAWGWKERT